MTYLQAGLRFASPRPLHRPAVAAWPWVDPAVDVAPKPRQSSEQASPRTPELKLNVANLLSRGPADDGASSALSSIRLVRLDCMCFALQR